MGKGTLQTLKAYRFLLEELVKRDFKKKYKGAVLGMGWSMLTPLLTLLVMKVVFENFFGHDIAHYTTYLFCGNLLFAWYSESTNLGIRSLRSNASLFTKVNVPKYLFLLSGSVQTLINFLLTLVVFFLFCALDHISFSWRFVCLLYPIATFFLFTVGCGLILSALHVFFRDIDYIWRVALQLTMYGSAIFYSTERLPSRLQALFAFNPVYRHIAYFREVVIGGSLPDGMTHIVLLSFAVVSILIGSWMYRHYNTRFLYYV